MVLGLLRNLTHVICNIPVIFLFCMLKQNLAEENIFHSQNAFGIREEKRSPRCFTGTFEA